MVDLYQPLLRHPKASLWDDIHAAQALVSADEGNPLCKTLPLLKP